MEEMIEYIKIHLISLEQDLQAFDSEDSIGYLETMASIITSRHYLSVATDILAKTSTKGN